MPGKNMSNIPDKVCILPAWESRGGSVAGYHAVIAPAYGGASVFIMSMFHKFIGQYGICRRVFCRVAIGT